MYLAILKNRFTHTYFLFQITGKGLKIWVTCSLEDHKQQILDDFNTLPNTAGTWRPLKPNFKTSVKSRAQTIQYPPINHPLNLQALCWGCFFNQKTQRLQLSGRPGWKLSPGEHSNLLAWRSSQACTRITVPRVPRFLRRPTGPLPWKQTRSGHWNFIFA